MAYGIYQSPFGALTLTGHAGRVQHLCFPGRAPAPDQGGHAHQGLADALDQLEEYFSGDRHTFELRLDLHGTAFQRRVWRALQRIPYGTTTTYSALADQLTLERGGRPVEPRALAGAVARTPAPIIIPCHRVIASDGSLRGYVGGLQRKRALLDLEARAAGGITLGGDWHRRQLALL
jgi:methylated-DNA-[protein]-cysteine S-methyltransferase